MNRFFSFVMLIACLVMGMPGNVWAQDEPEEPEEYVFDLSDISSAYDELNGYSFTNLTLKNGEGIIYSWYYNDGTVYDNLFYFYDNDNNPIFIYLNEGGTLKLENWGDKSESWKNNDIDISFANNIHFIAENCHTWISAEKADPSSIYINGGEIGLYGNDFLRTTDNSGSSVANLESFIVEGNTYFSASDLNLIKDKKRLHPNGRMFDKLKTIKINSTYYDASYPDDYYGYGVWLTSYMFDGCYRLETLELNSPALTYIPPYCFAQYAATEITLPPYLKEVGNTGFGKYFNSEGYWADYKEKGPRNTGKMLGIISYSSAYSVKYMEDGDTEKPKNGFPPSLEMLDANAFYGHRMHELHIPKTLKTIGSWALAGIDKGYDQQNIKEGDIVKKKYWEFVFTFDEDYERPITIGDHALYNANKGINQYEIRIPQKYLQNFLDGQNSDATSESYNDDGSIIPYYNIKYALADNAIKPYVKFTTSAATAVDGDGNNAYKQTAWLPYASKPEKISRLKAGTEKKENMFNNDSQLYTGTLFDWKADSLINAYYVGGKFIQKSDDEKEENKYDKVVLTAVNDTIVPANTPVMITSNTTTTDLSDMMIVTFNLGTTGLDADGKISNQKFYQKNAKAEYIKDADHELVLIDPKDSENWQKTYGAPLADVNWLKAYTDLDDNGFMQSVQALRYSWNGVTDTDYTNFVLVGGVFKLLVTSGDSPLNPGKAIMSMPSDKYTRITSGSGAKGIQMVFADDEDVITGIREHQTSIIDSSAWYNLQGQRVAHPQNGIFIHNGKKVVVK